MRRHDPTRHHRRSIARRIRIAGLAILLCAATSLHADERDPGAPETWRIEEADLHGVASRGAQVWAVGYWGTVLHSTDAGRTWQRAPTPTARTLFAVSFADDRHGWAVGEDGVVLHSDDGGRSWVRQTVRTRDETGEVVDVSLNLFDVAAISPRDVWIVGDLGIVLRSRDGARWERVFLSEDVFGDEETPERIFNAVHFHDAERGWIVGEFGTVLRTVDGGETWSGERVIAGAPDDLYLFDVGALDASRIAATALGGVVIVSSDGGATFEPRTTALDASLYAIAWGNPDGIAVGDRGEIVATPDEGRTWLPALRPPLFEWLSDLDEVGLSVHAVGERGVILRSDDGGASWKQLRGPEPTVRPLP